MATLVLQAAGQAVGGLLGPVGAIVGRAAGALAGNMIDQRLFGESSTRSVGRIDDVSVQTASEGNPIPKVYGRMRLAGTVIWATDFEETTRTSSVGGKGGGPKVREYSYHANFAVGICEGPIARIATSYMLSLARAVLSAPKFETVVDFLTVAMPRRLLNRSNAESA